MRARIAKDEELRQLELAVYSAKERLIGAARIGDEELLKCGKDFREAEKALSAKVAPHG
jgi:hypothetical protein